MAAPSSAPSGLPWRPAADADGGHAAFVRSLQGRLSQALAERDDLARDVEELCMESSAATFSSSSVLQERIFSAEKELSQTKAQLLAATGERDSLREDLREVREAKRLADHAYREQGGRVTALERELSFYRQQAKQAMADRDASAWECEELRKHNLQLDAKAREAEGRAEAASADRAATERRLSQAEARAAGLAATAAEAAVLPALRANLSTAHAQIRDLQRQREKRAAEREGVQGELEEERAARQAAVEAGRAEAERAEQMRQAAEAAAAEARQELEDVARQKLQALVRLSDAEGGRAKADGEVVRLRAALAAAQGQLAQATQEKVEALMQAASLRAASEGDEPLRSPTRTPRSAAANRPASPEKWKMPWLGSASKTPPSPSKTPTPPTARE